MSYMSLHNLPRGEYLHCTSVFASTLSRAEDLRKNVSNIYRAPPPTPSPILSLTFPHPDESSYLEALSKFFSIYLMHGRIQIMDQGKSGQNQMWFLHRSMEDGWLLLVLVQWQNLTSAGIIAPREIQCRSSASSQSIGQVDEPTKRITGPQHSDTYIEPQHSKTTVNEKEPSLQSKENRLDGVIEGFASALERIQTQINSLQNEVKAMKLEDWPDEVVESDRGM